MSWIEIDTGFCVSDFFCPPSAASKLRPLATWGHLAEAARWYQYLIVRNMHSVQAVAE